MKGIMIFDNLNDLIFLDVDEELSDHIQKLAIKDGLIEDIFLRCIDQKADKNIIMQLFSPLIASYKVMQAQFGNKYKYIESEDGVLLVFDEILNYIAISVCSKEETLEEIQKELSLFLIVVETLYGPALHMIKSDITACCDETSRRHLVSLTLNKWRTLKMQQQMYLVEAVERLIINQDITAMCVNLLQEVLEKIRHTRKDGTYSHAIAVVDTKLLALYSSRNAGQLLKETLLLLILLAQVLQCSSNVPKEGELEQTTEDEFFVPITSTVLKSNQPNEESAVRNHEKMKRSSESEKSNKMKIGSHSLLVYLKSRVGLLVPHIMYVIEVTQRIYIIILNELTTYGVMSSTVKSLAEQLNNLQYHPSARTPLGSFENLETEFRNLIDMVYKMKNVVGKEKYLRKLVTKWEQLEQYELEVFFQLPKDKITNPRLESGLSSCCDLLKSFFEESISIPCLKYEEKTQGDEFQEVLKLLQRHSIRRLTDVANFLEVKAMQNITMASYITEYPGLIHFIYIDRNSDCLIAPNVVLKKGHLSGATSLKQKIWKMVSIGRQYIDAVNKYCCLWKYDDLYFFYHVWFEDSSGRTIKPTSYPSLKKFPPKGIICGNFYKRLVQECFPTASHDHILCYEFFCVHLESVPVELIVEHSRNLCSQLWEFSGAYRTSLDLL